MRVAGLVVLVVGLAATGPVLAQSTPQDPYQPSEPPPAQPPPAQPTEPPPPPPADAGPPPPAGDQGQAGPGAAGGVAPAVPREPSTNVSDFGGYLGAVIFQRRSAFDNRDAGFAIGAERQRIVSQLLYMAWDAEIGLTGDSDDKDNSGFRIRGDYLVGIGFSRASGYVAIGGGLGFNGETDVIPIALTVPVELRVNQWLAPAVRASFMLRADRFIGVYDSRQEAADGYWQFDELSAGIKLGFMRSQDDSETWEGGQPTMKGITVGAGYHRTMGSGVWLFTLGVVASTIPTR